ncbi:uncharacterized protein [Rutidosis leptorrhynchoides]|uniref:uncharacterized protein n=1 Tax=Rutidosis leptorrhynchoides TaxID=125765 RepID=UPI003A9A288F
MEIPVINRISADFDIGINSLQNPNFLSQILAVSGSGIDHIYRQRYTFVTWGALIIALLASFTTIINRFQLLIIKFRSRHKSLYHQPLLNGDDFDDDDSDSDESFSSDEEEEEEEEDDEEEEDEEIFGTRGQNSNSSIRRRRNGKSVMKFWDNLGFNFSSDNLIALYDSVTFNGFTTALDSDNVVLTATNASSSSGGCVSFKAWDTRVGCKIPSILAEWRPMKKNLLEKVNNVGLCGAYNFCITDDVKSAVVGDIRNVSSPLADLTEADERWWDAASVVDGSESVVMIYSIKLSLEAAGLIRICSIAVLQQSNVHIKDDEYLNYEIEFDNFVLGLYSELRMTYGQSKTKGLK